MISTKFLSPEERNTLETFLRARLDTDARDACMILTALHSGARAQELLSLRWQDIDTNTGTIYLATLKGGRPREIFVPAFIKSALARLRELSPERPFPISYSRLVEIWHLYRTVKKPFKALRHSFAMRCYDRTKDVRFVQRALGHRSLQNTMVYLEYQYTANEFKKLMRIK